jgi:hypothetical protein
MAADTIVGGWAFFSIVVRRSAKIAQQLVGFHLLLDVAPVVEFFDHISQVRPSEYDGIPKTAPRAPRPSIHVVPAELGRSQKAFSFGNNTFR